jgi:YidC/Oxa1 family membrane protein insertase
VDSKRMLLMVAAIAGIVLLLMLNSQNAKKEDLPTEADPAAAQPADPSAPVADPADPVAEPAEASSEAEAAAVPADAAPAAAATHHYWAGSDQSGGEKTVTLGSLDAEGEFRMQVELSSKGASILSARLTDHFITSEDRRLYNDDPAAYEQARLADPEKHKGRYELFTPTSAVMAMATRTIRVELIADTPEAVEAGELIDPRFDKQLWSLTHRDDQSATFTYMIYIRRPDGTAIEAMRLDKTYRIEPNSYSLTVSYDLVNLTDAPLRFSLDQVGATGLEREDRRMDNRHAVYGRVEGEERVVQVVLDSYKKLSDIEKVGEAWGTSEERDPIVWGGMTNKYFAMLIHLAPETGEAPDAPSWQADFYVQPSYGRDELPRYVTGIRLGRRRDDEDGPVWGVRIKPNSTRTATFNVYAGPKDRSIFSDAGHPLYRPLYSKLNYLSSINFGGCFCTWTWLAFKVMWILKGLAVLTFGNYGLAIILMVFFVRLLLHPLAKKSQISMLKMQKLGPEMKKLQAKHAGDKETLNREMMKFYRENGASPLLGCLPMFLQMPIWIALYTGINASIELRHAAFLPVWITDLAAADALVTWSNPIPLIGTSFNLLPLLLVVAMFLQMKLTPQMTQPGADGAQQQQKMMKILMPLMMLFFFYQAPSGLTLYVMASTAAGALDSYLIRRHVRAKEAMEAAMETTIDAPGKAARSARPKKPKGPMWSKQ